MPCHNCDWSMEPHHDSNNFVCMCNELFEGAPNEHYLHVLHGDHSCIQDSGRAMERSAVEEICEREQT